jgi:radical SAM superfamily enzyme YgiQ (UPF0313 family)
MDLLLVNSPLFETSGAQQEDSLPPLGLGYIATSTRNEGFDVALLDAVATDCGIAGVIGLISSSRPRLVGLNVFSTNLGLVEQIITAPLNAHIIVGGPAVRALSDIVLGWETQNSITIIEGEAEYALPAFLKGTLEGQLWRGREDRRIIQITPDHPLHPRVIDLPLDRQFFQNEPITDKDWNVREAHIIATRGCGHDCAFCGAARSVNPVPVRFRSEADIRAELDHIRHSMPHTNGIRVIDDLFIRNRRAIEQACRLFRETGFKWRAMAHVNGLREASKTLYEEMLESGCLELFVGVESGNPGRRKMIGKPVEVQPTIDTVSNLLCSGIAVKAYFIFGFPGETKLEMEDTFAVAATMADVAARVGTRFRTSVFKFRPYHGTRIYNELVASGANLGRIEVDLPLTAANKRRQFSFMGDNYSSVDLETLNKFTRATQELRYEGKSM